MSAQENAATREAPTLRGRGSQPELREEQARGLPEGGGVGYIMIRSGNLMITAAVLSPPETILER